jgi:hypothetical protein
MCDSFYLPERTVSANVPYLYAGCKLRTHWLRYTLSTDPPPNGCWQSLSNGDALLTTSAVPNRGEFLWQPLHLHPEL